MNVKRRLAVAMASAAVAAGSVAAVGLPATSAHAATTTSAVALPIPYYSHMLLDPAHHHIFITSGLGPSNRGSSSILVTNYSGQTVATIPNESSATALALSSDGSTVYAVLPSGWISAISTSTLAETARYFTGTYVDPAYVAYAGGKIWFSYHPANSAADFQSGIGSIDPSTSPATVTLNATNDPVGTWSAAPRLAASSNGELVAGGPPNQGSIQLASYDVSSGTAAVLTPPMTTPTGGNVQDMQITPDGKDVVVASGSPYYHQIFQVSDLSAVGEYPTTAFPASVSIASDGTVAAGTTGNSGEAFMFAPDGSTPLNTYSFGSSTLDVDGLAITPDGSELFAITSPVPSLNVQPTLNIITDPAQVASTLGVTGPATIRKDQAITLTGTLGGASPYAGGQTLTVTRIDPDNPGGVALPDVTTAANGTFTITDTPPKFNGDTGTVTYQVSYVGDQYLTAITASASVIVRSDNS